MQYAPLAMANLSSVLRLSRIRGQVPKYRMAKPLLALV